MAKYKKASDLIDNRIEKAKSLPAINIKLLSENAKEPYRKPYSYDSGLDLYVSEYTVIPAGETIIVPTDVAIELKKGYEAQIRSRSSVSLKGDLLVHLGTIDYSYHKPLGIITTNMTDRDILIRQHERIAQLVVAPVVYPDVNIVSEFGYESNRGGFGSSGV
ncbi:dUTP pyrophosphatase [Macrococcoides bohemicum]|nr:dUTP pyrophosphatase [Macrococcus bohemicus]TDL39456.1 dUTP pyrophosphatase [Macrococcus bohemicus]